MNIFLLGHRKQHGKDTCCNILEKYFKNNEINYCRTFFAKILKLEVAEKYNLDAKLMEFDDYKNLKPQHLHGESVRDVLLRHGREERAKYKDVWAYKAYKEIFDSNKEVAVITDFRFPNEFSSVNSILEKYKNEVNNGYCLIPKIHKILVHKPNGKFVNDGADDQLEDVSNYWDYIVYNDSNESDWEKRLEDQIVPYVTKILKKEDKYKCHTK